MIDIITSALLNHRELPHDKCDVVVVSDRQPAWVKRLTVSYKKQKLLCGFSTYETRSGSLAGIKGLHRRPPVQGSVRLDVIVEVLGVGEGGGDSELAAVEVPELDTGAVVGAFDAAVELGSWGRQDKPGDIEWLAGWLELGHELGAAVDRDGVGTQGSLKGAALGPESRAGGRAFWGVSDGDQGPSRRCCGGFWAGLAPLPSPQTRRGWRPDPFSLSHHPHRLTGA